MKRIFALIFLPIRLLVFSFHWLVQLQSKGSHVYVRIPAKFSDSQKSYLLRKLQGEDEPPFIIDFLFTLSLLEKDPRVRYLTLEIPRLEMGFSEVNSIFQSLSKIRDKGIEIRAFAEEGDLKTLYLMTVANLRYSSEMGEFHSILPSSEALFFGGLARKLDIRVDVFQSGAYKSFGEVFTRKAFSPEARSNLQELIGDLKSAQLSVLCTDTGISEEDLQNPILNAKELHEKGFFTGLIGIHAFQENFLAEDPLEAARLTDLDSQDTTKRRKKTTKKRKRKGKKANPSHPAAIPMTRELTEGHLESRYQWENFRILGNNFPTLLVLPLKGQIVSGKPEEREPKSGVIEGYSIIPLLRDIADDSRITGVLLEIDSPGGSASESEKIYQAIRDLDRKKPVFAYMSNTCASGGYYLACATRKVYSGSIGIVGSIGTIMLRFDLEGFYAKWGISKDRIGFYPKREIFSESGKLSRESQAFLKKEIARVENLFLQRVKDSRGLEDEQILPMAGGRVFSPLRFLEAGLVDGLGSLWDCIELLKTELNTQNVNIAYQAPRYNMKLALREGLLPRGTQGKNLVQALSGSKDPQWDALLQLVTDLPQDIQHFNLGSYFLRQLFRL